MSRLYQDPHRALQDTFNTRALADRVEQAALRDQLDPRDQMFIESRDMMFLSTIGVRAEPTVSYKGGDPGFVKVLNPKTLAFPSYDGNGMFLSMGNLTANPAVGMLFVDFETPNRLRVQGHAEISATDPLLATSPGADLIVRVTVTEVWDNCSRYVHRYRKVDRSKYVPVPGQPTPLPAWKRIAAIQDVLAADDRTAAEAAGLITEAEYAALLAAGDA